MLALLYCLAVLAKMYKYGKGGIVVLLQCSNSLIENRGASRAGQGCDILMTIYVQLAAVIEQLEEEVSCQLTAKNVCEFWRQQGLGAPYTPKQCRSSTPVSYTLH